MHQTLDHSIVSRTNYEHFDWFTKITEKTTTHIFDSVYSCTTLVTVSRSGAHFSLVLISNCTYVCEIDETNKQTIAFTSLKWSSLGGIYVLKHGLFFTSIRND